MTRLLGAEPLGSPLAGSPVGERRYRGRARSSRLGTRSSKPRRLSCALPFCPCHMIWVRYRLRQRGFHREPWDRVRRTMRKEIKIWVCSRCRRQTAMFAGISPERWSGTLESCLCRRCSQRSGIKEIHQSEIPSAVCQRTARAVAIKSRPDSTAVEAANAPRSTFARAMGWRR